MFKYVLIKVLIKLALSPYVPLVQYQLPSFKLFSAKSHTAESITSVEIGAGLMNT